jgi:hypothetical protein
MSGSVTNRHSRVPPRHCVAPFDCDWKNEELARRRVKGAQTIDRRLDRGVRTIGPLSRGRFRSCSWLWYISCCAVWSR